MLLDGEVTGYGESFRLEHKTPIIDRCFKESVHLLDKIFGQLQKGVSGKLLTKNILRQRCR